MLLFIAGLSVYNIYLRISYNNWLSSQFIHPMALDDHLNSWHYMFYNCLFVYFPWAQPEIDLLLFGLVHLFDLVFDHWIPLMGGWWSLFRSIPHHLATDIQALSMFKHDVHLTFHPTRSYFPTRSCSPLQSHHYGTYLRLHVKFRWTRNCTRQPIHHKWNQKPMSYDQLRSYTALMDKRLTWRYIRAQHLEQYDLYVKSTPPVFSTQTKLDAHRVPEHCIGSLFKAVEILDLIKETIKNPDQPLIVLAWHLLIRELGLHSVSELGDSRIPMERVRVSACVAKTDEPLTQG
jgi:hypothetical protein